MAWHPSLGAWIDGNRTHFRVWAPEVRKLELVLEGRGTYHLEKSGDGTWTTQLAEIGAGTRYRYLVDDNGPFPDPAARFQPEGVHGPSEVIDPSAFRWTDAGWPGLGRDPLACYELHVGTFTPAGTFAGILDRLPYLADLGLDAIELMPLSDFPGQRNWGYDGVCPFAPARCYGRPDDLRRLIDTAHSLGLGVLLDVVCNHLGPDGNYTGVYSPYYFSKKHHTPWGDALNFDGAHSARVREFFIENVLYWIHEYHIDGVRLDATHAIHDDGPRHFLAELAGRVRETTPDRHVPLIAEDHGNLALMVRPRSAGGWGLDGLWADDFHHQVRRHLAGDDEGYYRDYRGTTADLAATINQGWFFTGQHSEHLRRPRGSDPAGLPRSAFVVCLQNHDQVGNRAFGERLHHQIDPAAYRAASVLLLCAPASPSLFMGQEWAASAPFRYFTDHTPDLGRMVTEGRRQEFRQFAAFRDPEAREKIPDPQAVSTFEASRLDWQECDREPHRGTLWLYRELLHLRRTEPALLNTEPGSFAARAAGESAVVLRRDPGLMVVCQLRGAGRIEVPGRGTVLLTTEEERFCQAPRPPAARAGGESMTIEFQRPGAVILRIA